MPYQIEILLARYGQADKALEKILHTMVYTNKVFKHTVSPITPFTPPDRRFGHIHVDLVGPLSPSNGYKYLLTCLDRYTRWPEAWPMDNMSTYIVAAILTTQWISRFGVPDVVTTDQGRQFESELFTALTKNLGIQHLRTSPYHLQANGLVETFYRTLVSMSLRLSGEFFHPAPPEAKTAPELVRTLRDAITQLQPIPGSNHTTMRSIFVPLDLNKVTHVFLRVEAVQPPLKPRYESPHAVLRHENYLKIQRDNNTVLVCIDRMKPAIVLREDPTATEHTYLTHAEVEKQPKKRVRFSFPPRGSSVASHNVTVVPAGRPSSAARPLSIGSILDENVLFF